MRLARPPFSLTFLDFSDQPRVFRDPALVCYFSSVAVAIPCINSCKPLHAFHISSSSASWARDSRPTRRCLCAAPAVAACWPRLCCASSKTAARISPTPACSATRRLQHQQFMSSQRPRGGRALPSTRRLHSPWPVLDCRPVQHVDALPALSTLDYLLSPPRETEPEAELVDKNGVSKTGRPRAPSSSASTSRAACPPTRTSPTFSVCFDPLARPGTAHGPPKTCRTHLLETVTLAEWSKLRSGTTRQYMTRLDCMKVRILDMPLRRPLAWAANHSPFRRSLSLCCGHHVVLSLSLSL